MVCGVVCDGDGTRRRRVGVYGVCIIDDCRCV